MFSEDIRLVGRFVKIGKVVKSFKGWAKSKHVNFLD
jgi:hypothetical protein